MSLGEKSFVVENGVPPVQESLAWWPGVMAWSGSLEWWPGLIALVKSDCAIIIIYLIHKMGMR